MVNLARQVPGVRMEDLDHKDQGDYRDHQDLHQNEENKVLLVFLDLLEPMACQVKEVTLGLEEKEELQDQMVQSGLQEREASLGLQVHKVRGVKLAVRVLLV